MSDRSVRTVRLNMRLPAEKMAAWKTAAESEGISLTRFVEEAVDAAVATGRFLAEQKRREAEEARRWHSIDPTRARERDWGRLGGKPDDEGPA